eukprot:scaffold8463_cov22-Tisochrysis_lutea.AAC.1
MSSLIGGLHPQPVLVMLWKKCRRVSCPAHAVMRAQLPWGCIQGLCATSTFICQAGACCLGDAYRVMCNNYEGKLVQESPFSEKRRGKER